MRNLSFGMRVVGGLGSGALFAASFPPYNAPYLLPLAIAALLFLLRNVTVREAAYIGLACGAVYFGGTLFWLSKIFAAAALSFCAMETVYIGAFASLTVWLARRHPHLPLWLIAAVTWTALEYCRSELFPLPFGWMGLGYAVVNSPVLVQVAAWVGSYGLTFGIVAMGAILAGGHPRRAVPRIVGMLAAWIVLLLIPRAVPAPARPLTVRLVQAGPENTEGMILLSRAAPGQAADVIVWPEYSVMRDPIQDVKLWRQLEGTARENRAFLIFGGEDHFLPQEPTTYRNTAYVLDPDGRLVGRHFKNHPVHFISDGVRSTTARAVPTALGPLGVAICFDMDYPDVARRLAADGAEALLVPNMDPREWGPVQRAQHRLMFQMRAVESGRWLARADVAGGTSAVAPTGAEVAHVVNAEPTALSVRVGRETGRTLYVRYGWRFSQACLIALGLLCLGAMLPRRGRA